jgi:hypothetical protein
VGCSDAKQDAATDGDNGAAAKNQPRQIVRTRENSAPITNSLHNTGSMGCAGGQRITRYQRITSCHGPPIQGGQREEGVRSMRQATNKSPNKDKRPIREASQSRAWLSTPYLQARPQTSHAICTTSVIFWNDLLFVWARLRNLTHQGVHRQKTNYSNAPCLLSYVVCSNRSAYSETSRLKGDRRRPGELDYSYVQVNA